METLKKRESARDVVNDSHPSVLFSSRYELVRLLKEGGTSRIYLVRDKLCYAKLAVVKCICTDVPRNNRLAITEFSVGRAISHPNIINIYNVHRSAQSEYLVMEYLEGVSLKDFLSREALTSEQVIELIRPVVDALAHLHKNGIVHSDIKPSNIIVGANHSAKVIDLANCRQDSNNQKPVINVKENSFFGFSEYYSSPQVVSDMPATTSDDVYSLAMVIYEMLMGSMPVDAFKNGVLCIDLINKPKTINYLQWKVLKKAMRPSSNERYASVQSFFSDFCRARQSTYFIVGVVALCASVFLIAGYFSSQWEHYRSDYRQYQAAHQQLDSIATLSHTIRQSSPEERHLKLRLTDGLDEFSRRLVLNEVYSDVMNPFIDRVDGVMLNQSKPSEMLALHNELSALSAYYKNSKEISRLIEVITSEQRLRFQRVLIVATELIDANVYDEMSAEAIKNHAQRYEYEWLDVEQQVDLSAYFSQVEAAIASESWSVAIRLYRFAHVLSDVLPQAMQVWARHSSIAEHVQRFSVYLSSNQQVMDHFPKRSAEFFFADRFNALNQSLNNVWFNKDIKHYSTELLAIKSEYNIPENYDKYQQTYGLLLEKIDNKIQYHRRSGQRQSMQYLIDLKNTLS